MNIKSILLKILVIVVLLAALTLLLAFIGLDPKTLTLLAIGGAIVVGLYLLHLALTQGLPAVWAKILAWRQAAKSDLAGLKGDFASFQQTVEARLSAVEQLVLPKPAATAAPAPAAAAAPAPAPAPVA